VESGVIKNVVIKEVIINHKKIYKIYPEKGYKLHEKSRDEIVIDENGNETGEINLGYTEGVITASADYDFAKNEREIYSVAI
jgi:hypothetical protein